MIVLCLEGCHGSGKTELCRQFQACGYNVLDEAFLDMPRFDLHPQSLVMETMWVSHWMQRLLAKHGELQGVNGKDRIFIADRSPFSAVFYARKGGEMLEPIIHQMIDELRVIGIHIFTVVISVHRELLWQRIQDRLAREPARLAYNEADKAWMQKTLDFYNSRNWDFIIENNDTQISQVMESLLCLMSKSLTHIPEFDDYRGVLQIQKGKEAATPAPVPATTPASDSASQSALVAC